MTEIVRGRPSVKESFGFGNPNDNGRVSMWPPEDAIPGFKEVLLGFYQVRLILNPIFRSEAGKISTFQYDSMYSCTNA